jgi:hypothetical protein
MQWALEYPGLAGRRRDGRRASWRPKSWPRCGPPTGRSRRRGRARRSAYNTVQTILVRLYEKGLIGRVADGRRHEYFAVKGAEELAAEQMQALLSRGRDRQAVLQRFATSLSVEDARLLQAMLRRRP